MHRVFAPDHAPADYNYEEYCPHCDNSIPVVVDNDCTVGCYKMVCPVCGNKLMLCTLCHDDQQDIGEQSHCDWCEGKGCYREKEVS